MTRGLTRRIVLASVAAGGLSACVGRASASLGSVTRVTGARWWNGDEFVSRPVYFGGGRFLAREPGTPGRALDLSGAWLIPPFADAHNHGIGTGDPARDGAMIARYVADGVLYMQSHGNFPLSPADRARLGLGGASGLDASLAQGSITGVGGHSMGFIRDRLLPDGWFPGHTLETLDNRRFYQVDSEADLAAKWPLVLAAGGDFVKFFLFNARRHAERRADPAFFGRRGVDPALAPSIVWRAHEAGLRASAHVVDADDFGIAVAAGADIVAHVPRDGLIAADDAARAADRGVVVITTCAFVARIAGAERDRVVDAQKRNLERLLRAGVALAIGSDDPADTSGGEVEHLASLGLFTRAELLAMWTRTTPRAIFPDRAIGRIAPGHEASFVALDGDPLADWGNVKRIRARMKRGVLLGP